MKSTETSQQKVARSAGFMGLGVLLSRILGLVREQMMAALFGASHASDAFNIAFRIPNLLRDLFAEGAMSAAFVPVFVEAKEKEGEKRAYQVAGRVFRFLFLITSFLALVGILFSEELVKLYAASFSEVPGKLEQTVTLTQILFPYFPFIVLAAAFMAVLNSKGVFFLPAISTAISNLVFIVFGVLFYFLAPSLGLSPIEGVCVAVLLGGLIQCLYQLPILYKKGYFYPKREGGDPKWFQDPALKKMLLLLIPGVLGLAATQINIMVNSILATSQEAGSVSWLNYAFRLMQFPIGLFGVSLAVATLPVVSALWVKKEYSSMKETLHGSFKQVFSVNIPASFGLYFLSEPIIQLIFEYGRFSHLDTQKTALALKMYAIGLVGYSTVKLLVPSFYAMGLVRVAVFSSLMSVGLNILFNLLLIKPLGFSGLALGTSVTAILNALILFFFLKAKLSHHSVTYGVKEVLKPIGVHTLLSLGMIAVCLTVLSLWDFGFSLNALVSWDGMGVFGLVFYRFLRVFVSIISGVFILWFLAYIFNISETLVFFNFFIRKVRARF